MLTKSGDTLEPVTHTHTHTHGEPKNSLGLVGIEKIQINEKYIKLVM